MKILSALLLAIAISAPLAHADSISLDLDTDSFTEGDVVRAVDVFKQICKPLSSEYWADVDYVEAVAAEEFAPHRTALGWKNSIHLSVKLADNPRLLPPVDEEIGVRAGHTLHYDLGAGHRPGHVRQQARIAEAVRHAGGR